MRFDLIRATLEIDYLKRVIEYLQTPDHFPMGANPYTFEYEKNQKVVEMEEHLRFITKANEPGRCSSRAASRSSRTSRPSTTGTCAPRSTPTC